MGDSELFEITELDLDLSDDELIKKLLIRLTKEQDAEKPGDRNGDGVFQLVLNVEDNTTSSNNYTFNFHLKDIDEGPIMIVPDHSPDEEQTLAIPGITAIDPEGDTKQFSWFIDEEAGDASYFRLGTYDADSSQVDLLFKNDSLPSVENDEERDLNVTISI